MLTNPLPSVYRLFAFIYASVDTQVVVCIYEMEVTRMSVNSERQPVFGYPGTNTGNHFQNYRRTTTGGVRSSSDSSQLCRDPQQVRLTQKEHQLLCVLSQKAGRVIGERDLVEKAWDCEYDELTSSLDLSLYIRRLRMKLKNHHPAFELTRGRWGTDVGYRLVASGEQPGH